MNGKLIVMQAYVALSTRKTSLLGTQDWMEIPFLHRSKTEFDYVIDTLLLLDTKSVNRNKGDTKTDKWGKRSESLGSDKQNAESTASSEHIIRILVNLRDLVSAYQS